MTEMNRYTRNCFQLLQKVSCPSKRQHFTTCANSSNTAVEAKCVSFLRPVALKANSDDWTQTLNGKYTDFSLRQK